MESEEMKNEASIEVAKWRFWSVLSVSLCALVGWGAFTIRGCVVEVEAERTRRGERPPIRLEIVNAEDAQGRTLIGEARK